MDKAPETEIKKRKKKNKFDKGLKFAKNKILNKEEL